jgi:hypothetical protein
VVCPLLWSMEYKILWLWKFSQAVYFHRFCGQGKLAQIKIVVLINN